MKPYNIEIYDNDFNLKDHTNISEFKYNYDYLDPVNNKVKIFAPFNVTTDDYIRITGDDLDCWEMVTRTERGTDEAKEFINITSRNIEDRMNIDILVDTDLIGAGTLESFIADRIEECFITNTDTDQRIKHLSVRTESETFDWTLDISPREGEHFKVVNLLDDIILPAFKRDSIRVLFEFSNKEIRAVISKTKNQELLVELDQPNILTKTVKYKSINREANKLIIYNSKNYPENKVYYLHTDGSFDDMDADRVLPISLKVETISAGEDFEAKAHERARKTFGANKYENLIEIECEIGDERIKPVSIEVGQMVRFFDMGSEYVSILTGKKIDKTARLIFGNIRLELSKILKGRS